ncbi:MAG: 1-acyl-sn-glycerol-3-phosphate acyltransferase [Candidatus Marinimicrobia bacterium]|nr:1-acyl-sn-glycerol-3-phosphate acyltransferase [Candidatus Neomarinimicrobiota bacterium]
MIHYFLVLIFLVPWTFLGIVFVILGKFVNPGGQVSHQAGRLWSLGILKVSRMKIEVEGLDLIDPRGQYIFIANHTSAFDIPAVYWGLKNKLGMLAKQRLKYIPLFGWAMWAAGHFFVNRGNHRKAMAVMEQVADILSRRPDHSLVIFPEGTRSYDGHLQRFKKGAFMLALDTGIPIVPIIISGAFHAKQKKGNRIQATTIRILILPPVSPESYTLDTRDHFVEDVHQIFEQHYTPPSA